MKDDHGKSQAVAQLEAIISMVAALECDYERLEELKEEKADLESRYTEARDDTEIEEASRELEAWIEENAEELQELQDAAGECESREDAEQRIQEDPLSVEVRSGWATYGSTLEPEEFRILLCTGGPAVQIVGELDENLQPSRAWIEYQDWGTPWTELVYEYENGVMQGAAAVLTYCQQFYYGE